MANKQHGITHDIAVRVEKSLHEDGFRLMLHALLRDALMLSLFAFAALMTIEGLMPGFVSGHLNLAKVLFTIALLLFAFLAMEKSIAIASEKKETAQKKPTSADRKERLSKWLLIGLASWSSILILNSLIKFPFYAIVIIFILTAAIGKLLYDEFSA